MSCLFHSFINYCFAVQRHQMSLCVRKPTIWVPTRSDTNWAVQSSTVEELYYPCSENKGADQLRSYCEADLRLWFRLCTLLFFSCGGSNITYLCFLLHFFLPLYIRQYINALLLHQLCNRRPCGANFLALFSLFNGNKTGVWGNYRVGLAEVYDILLSF